jgi:AcrR family transcriptional regulator
VPRLIHGPSRAETLAAAINEVLVTDGIPALSLRRIAEVSGVSTGSMLHHFGGRSRLIGLAAALTARELQSEIIDGIGFEGVAAFLPANDDGVLLHRAWLAWVELGRSESEVEPVVTQARRTELGLLAQTTEHELVRDELDLLTAAIEGLRSAICAPVRPMPPRRARLLLEDHLARSGKVRRAEAGR